MLEKTTNLFCHTCLKIIGMDASASSKSCKENKHAQKRDGRVNSLCTHTGCKYDATICKNHIKENMDGQDLLRQAYEWKNKKLRELGHEPSNMALIARPVEPEVEDACRDA